MFEMSLLNLPGWKMLNLTTKDHDYIAEARYEPEPAACPHCAGTTLYKHGTHKQLVMDVPTHGKRMGIECQRVRYRCKGCGKTFLQPLPDVDEGG